MEDKLNNKSVQFPARMLTGAMVLTGLMLVAMAWAGVNSYRTIAAVQFHDLRIQELRGVIVHLDEVLTMSARMAAATGDSDWERRYRQFEPQLDAAIKEAMALTAHSDSAQAVAQTAAANLKLVEMEKASFKLVRAGDAGQAKAILFSAAYEAQKKIYAEGMVTLIRDLKNQLAVNQYKEESQALLSMIAVVFCIVFLLFTWRSAWRSLNYWRTRQSENLNALTEAEEALRKLNDGLEKSVEERTRALQSEIRERKDAEAALQQAQKIAHVGSWERDVVNQTVVWSDEQFHLFGFTPGEYAPDYNSIFSLVHPEDREAFLARNNAVLRTKKPAELDYRVIQPNGDIRVLHSRADVVLDDSGNVLRMMGTSQDITERKHAESELGQVHQRLLELSRQAGMAEMATGVLHNVGNVLNSVSVASSCVADSLKNSKSVNLSKVVALLAEHESDLGEFLTTDPKGRQVPGYLAQLAEHLAVERVASLKELAQLQKNIEHIKEVLTAQQTSAKSSGNAERVQVSELLEDTLRMDASGQTSRDILVIKEFEHTPVITVQKHKVMQILMNLLRNARQSCQEAGHQESRLILRVTNGDDRVRIAVSDNGVGISPENLARIFVHGFSTKKEGHGFGLHSAVVAARELGGSLTVQSDGIGHGATFTLDLPVQFDPDSASGANGNSRHEA